MKKKYLIMFSILTACFITGCSKTSPELSYSGNEILYTCTKEDLNLFNETVNVNITDKQGFVIIDSNSEIQEYTNNVLEFTKENKVDIKNCFFVSYEEVTKNKFNSQTAIIHKDPVKGEIKINVSGNYSYKVINSKNFFDIYSTSNELNNYINANIISVYTSNIQSKTYSDLTKEKKFNKEQLKSLNVLVNGYGIEITKVNIKSVKQSN